MEELQKKVEEVLDQFAKEEIGNRLSQFAMLSLKSIVRDLFEKALPVGEKPPN